MKTVRYETDERIATITIDRPDKLNALNGQVLDDLERAVEQAENDDGVRGVLLTGAGEKAFVAGADISQFPDLDLMSGQRFALRGQAVFSQLENLSKPVVAAVNGFALGGGCELALACHLRLASENAQFGQPEVGLGIIPGYGGTQRLPRIVGQGRATELILTGERIDAERAHTIGLVNRILPAADLMGEAHALLQTITENAPRALDLALQALRHADRPLDEGLRHESNLFGKACDTADAREGAKAFMEKRTPQFEGR